MPSALASNMHIYTRECQFDYGSIVFDAKERSRPPPSIDYLVCDQYLQITTVGHFDEFGQLSVAESGQSYTSTPHDLAFEPITKSK